MSREFIGGLVGGAVSGAAVAGLMKIRAPAPAPAITSNKQIIAQKSLPANTINSQLLPSTNFKFAIILFHGNGDGNVNVSIRGATTRSVLGNEQAIEVIANETIEILASTESGGNTPTIEILSLTW